MIRTLSRAALAAATLFILAAPAIPHEGHDHGDAPAPATVSETITVGDLEISGAFTRATLPNQPVGGGYVTITNTGDTEERLIGGTAGFAGEVQVHEMAMVDDVMNMRQLGEGLAIPAGETVTLEPGGYHLMFMGMQEALVEGQTATVTLEFERAGSVEVTFAIAAAGARTAPEGHDCPHGEAE